MALAEQLSEHTFFFKFPCRNLDTDEWPSNKVKTLYSGTQVGPGSLGACVSIGPKAVSHTIHFFTYPITPCDTPFANIG